jgi:hypothetical protein
VDSDLAPRVGGGVVLRKELVNVLEEALLRAFTLLAMHVNGIQDLELRILEVRVRHGVGVSVNLKELLVRYRVNMGTYMHLKGA